MSDPHPQPRPARDRFGHAAVDAPPPAEPENLEETPAPRRTWPRLLLGIVVVAMLAGAVVGGRAWGRHGLADAWQLTRPVPAGHRLKAGDLRRVIISRSAVQGPLPSAPPTGLVTRTAVPAGALVGPRLVAPGGVVPGPGEVLVGVAVGPGFAPADLSPGMRVDVLSLPPSDQPGDRPDRRSPGATSLGASTVEQVTRGAGGTVVTLVLPGDLATRVAALSAAGRVALVATAR